MKIVLLNILILFIWISCNGNQNSRMRILCEDDIPIKDSLLPDIQLLDTFLFKGYVFEFKRIKFQNYNKGSLICSVEQLKGLKASKESDFYENMVSKGCIPVLWIAEADFPFLRWNLMNPRKQHSEYYMSNVPQKVLDDINFNNANNFGSFEFNINERLTMNNLGEIIFDEYRISGRAVEIAGIKMRVNRDVSLPFQDGFLESMLLSDNGKVDVFVPMAINQNKEINKAFYDTYFNNH